MSNYTMTLKRVCDVYGYEEVTSWFSSYELRTYLTQEQVDVIEETEIWSKDILATEIVNHYITREIAFETPYLFRHKAKVKMDELMEKYAPLIYANSLQMQYNPLTGNQTFSETESYTKTTADSSSTSSSSSSQSQSATATSGSSLAVHSDTPQGQISKSAILGGSYASDTEASESESSVNDSSNNSSSGTVTGQLAGNETLSRTKSGFDLKMTKADMILNYRKSIMAINTQIIEDLNSLFFALFD